MPFMDGHATSIALKKINPALKIIMASGNSPDKNGKRQPQIQTSAHLPRSLTTVEKLLTIVHEVLEAKS